MDIHVSKMYCIFLLWIFNVKVHSSKRCHITKLVEDILCDCSQSGFRTVPTRRIPYNTTILDLSGNSLTFLHSDSFSWLTKLQTLYLQSSRIAYISANAFFGLKNLHTLDLNTNGLDFDSLPPDIFNATPNLIYLDISDNAFYTTKEYPDKALSVLFELQELHISGINGAKFGKGFKSLIRLKTLKFQPCDITELKNDTFLMFKDVPIHEITLVCRIKTVDYGVMVPLQSVKILNVRNNKSIRVSDLVIILSVLKDKNMTRIDFSKNYRSRTGTDMLTPSQFSYFGDICVKEINISKNQISIIQSGSISAMKYKDCLETLDISRNNIYGDAGAALELFKLTNLRVIDFSGEIPFQVMFNKQLRYKTSGSPVYYFPLPPKLEYMYARHLGITNTALSNISFRFGKHLKLIDLNWTSFKNCCGQIDGLVNLQILTMSGFNCTQLNIELLRSFPSLKILESKNAHLGKGLKKDVNGEYLKGLNFLESIDFSDNHISLLHPNFFDSQFHSLANVTFSRNELTKFPFTVSKFSNLFGINLSGNRLRYLDLETTNDLDSAQSRVKNKLHLVLDGNTFECNCQSLHFIQWIHQTNISLDNNGNYSCLFIDGTHKTTFYAYKHITWLESKCRSKFWLIFSICLGLIFVAVIIGSSLAYRYRVTLHYWYLSIRRKYRQYSELDGESKEYKYSAFVAYHHNDYKWVCGPLCSYLETEKRLSLCLHHRDFSAGSYIADNIFEAISQSRKILLVISKSFLESSWCEFELDMARMQMFQESRDLLIVILLEQIPSTEMPNSLLRIWNRVTCLEADQAKLSNSNDESDQLFWKRLYQSVIM